MRRKVKFTPVARGIVVLFNRPKCQPDVQTSAALALDTSIGQDGGLAPCAVWLWDRPRRRLNITRILASAQ
jgi:hypothetical protein